MAELSAPTTGPDHTVGPGRTTGRAAATGPGQALRIGWLRGQLELVQFFRARESVIFSFLFPVILLVVFGAIFNFDIAPGVTLTQHFLAVMLASALPAAGV